MQFSDEYSFIVLQRVAEATKQAIKGKLCKPHLLIFSHGVYLQSQSPR